MPMTLWFLTALLCLGGTARALAQDAEAEADQEVRELQEPAPEAVELEMTSPTTTTDEVEWEDSAGDEVEWEDSADGEEVDEDHEDGPETFGDRFKRGDLFGYFDAQARFFPQTATSQAPGAPPLNDYWFNGSLAWEPGFFMNVTDNMNFELILFGRIDQHDRNRTHGDIREGFFELFFDEWTFGFGIHKVFWGVTESRHLVDIINQTDLVEDFDTDIKLGQAMVTTSYTNDKAGAFSLYVMSWARPLVFPGPQGRPTLP
ncbi:MAG: hypothetical protein DRH23_07455, partial [Deltaproteobacteria bacterium]